MINTYMTLHLSICLFIFLQKYYLKEHTHKKQKTKSLINLSYTSLDPKKNWHSIRNLKQLKVIKTKPFVAEKDNKIKISFINKEQHLIKSANRFCNIL